MRDLEWLLLERRRTLLRAPLAESAGAAVGMAGDGALVIRRSAGLNSMKLHVPLGLPNAFGIAPVSQQFTCAAILLLQRRESVR